MDLINPGAELQIEYDTALLPAPTITSPIGSQGGTAPVDYDGAVVWGIRGSNLGGAEYTELGTGFENTSCQYSVQGSVGAPYAAGVCWNVEVGGYEDWFLPAIDTLALMQDYFRTTGGFTEWRYWSSSQIDSESVWYQEFDSYVFVPDPEPRGQWKDAEQRVRAEPGEIIIGRQQTQPPSRARARGGRGRTAARTRRR